MTRYSLMPVCSAALAALFGFCLPSIAKSAIIDNSIAMKISGSDEYLRIPNSPSIDLTSGITVEAWAMFDGTEATPGMEIGMRGNNNQGYEMGIHAPSVGAPQSYGSGGVFGQFSTTSTAVNVSGFTGAFHSFVWTYNGSVSDLYLDGSLVATEAHSVPIGTTATDLYFGIGLNSDGTWNGATADGYYDEIRLWNYARSAAQIQSTWDTTLTGNEPGLVGYWNFNSGSGNDSTAYDNNGIASAGVEFVPVPEPTAGVLICLTVMPLLLGRHRRMRTSR